MIMFRNDELIIPRHHIEENYFERELSDEEYDNVYQYLNDLLTSNDFVEQLINDLNQYFEMK